MDESPLENSIREESARAIDAVKRKEELEIKQLNDAYAADMESFRKRIEAETKARINQELSRISNRAILERRKFNLQTIESFIEKIVDEVAKEIRSNPLYKRFLMEAVRDAAGKTSADIEIHIKPEDMPRKKEILAAAKTTDKNRNIAIKGDSGIHWGGCLVFDKKDGRIFNKTLDRIYFRKSTLIRQKILKIYSEHFQNKETSIHAVTDK